MLDTSYAGIAPLHPLLPHVIVYDKPACPKCRVTENRLATKGVPYLTSSLVENTFAYSAFTEELRIAAAPVVVAHNIFDQPVYWSDMRPDAIRALIEAWGQRVDVLVAADMLDLPRSYAQELFGIESSFDVEPGPSDEDETRSTPTLEDFALRSRRCWPVESLSAATRDSDDRIGVLPSELVTRGQYPLDRRVR